MNLDQYLIKEGYTHLRKSCEFCNKPRFFSDLCVEHAKDTMWQLNEQIEETGFALFIRTALRESGLLRDLDDFDQAVKSLYEGGTNPDEIADLLDVSVDYVKKAVSHVMS